MNETNLRKLLFPAAKAQTENVAVIADALSGNATDTLPLHDGVYLAKYLMDYWRTDYCVPEPGEDNGPPNDDELAQGAFADFVEIFSARSWNFRNYNRVRILGYDCSEVKNTVPDEWHSNDAGWEQIYLGSEWKLDANQGKAGMLCRVNFYDEGFGLAFWFYCTKEPDTL